MKGLLRSKRFLRPTAIVVVMAVIALSLSGSSAHARAVSPVQSSSRVRPKPYYLALGNSLAFGIQANGDYDHGYVADLFQDVQHEGVQAMANMACPGETSVTFRTGQCPLSQLRKYPYTGPQLTAALAFLQAHRGQVSPVTFDIGANDVLPDINPSTCQVDINKFQADLATLDSNLKGTILPQLHDALTVNGYSTGDLVMMNYYDPYQNLCPHSVPLIHMLNQHLANDVHGFGVIVNVFDAFGGAKVPNRNICVYTWICTPPPLGPNIHATDKGYQVIAHTFEDALQRFY